MDCLLANGRDGMGYRVARRCHKTDVSFWPRLCATGSGRTVPVEYLQPYIGNILGTAAMKWFELAQLVSANCQEIESPGRVFCGDSKASARRSRALASPRLSKGEPYPGEGAYAAGLRRCLVLYSIASRLSIS